MVERVTFQNAENGFCVVRVKVRGYRELVTLVGHAAVISAGEWVTASGEWVNDRTHGQQFKARFLKTSEPTSLDGIEKYLGSGMIRGVGPIYAKKLVRAFGEKVGHDVVLFASGDSQTSANLEACWPKALRLDGSVRDPNALHIAMLERVLQRAHDFDLLHFHLDYYPFSLVVSTGRRNTLS